jgi:hypothetical protein
MSLDTKNLNYDITAGDKTFDPVIFETDTAAIVVIYSGIDTDDVEIYLEQSVDRTNWNDVPDSTVILDKTKPSHMWNISIMRGIHIRVGLLKKTATTGTIENINTLT